MGKEMKGELILPLMMPAAGKAGEMFGKTGHGLMRHKIMYVTWSVPEMRRRADHRKAKSIRLFR
ncbi:hypothetical protein RUM43_000097 [Polyplax serrata]|uniref:Uncharacterized protein n=1 Tax=Polyplax serrata TaxID=468196 RepID=A0AAN8SDB6_POLSC